MRVDVYLALAGALALCLVARRAAGRLSPPLAALTLAGSGLVAAAAWIWNLGLLLGPLVGRLPYLAELGHWSSRALAANDPVPLPTASAAGLLVAVAAAGIGICGSQVAGELWRVRSVARRCDAVAGGDVVVVADPAVRALAVPGRRGRILLTTGMVRALRADERRVLLAHERAHLRHRHGLYRLGIRLAAAVLPVLRPLVARCDYELERWADEDAARAVGDRGLVAQALARAALAGRGGAAPAPAAGAPAFGEQGVAPRVRALLAGPPAPRLLPVAVPVAVALWTVAATIAASRDVEALFELAQRLWHG